LYLILARQAISATRYDRR